MPDPTPPVPIPPPSFATGGTSVVPAIAGAAVAAAEVAFPVLLPFQPMIALVLTAIRAHYNATGNIPTEAQVIAAVPADLQGLKNLWANWTPSGR